MRRRDLVIQHINLRKKKKIFNVLSNQSNGYAGGQRTFSLFSIKIRSQTATSFAILPNSRVCSVSSESHLLTISSIVFPRSTDGGGPEAGAAAGVVLVVAGVVVAVDGVFPAGAVVVVAEGAGAPKRARRLMVMRRIYA